MFKSFSRNGIPAVSKERKALLHRGAPLRSFELGIPAFDKIIHVFDKHGLGFGRLVYQNLLRAELDYRGLSNERNHSIQIIFQGEAIRVCKAKALRIH